MNKEQAKDKLIEILENQVVDLTLMSKIELGDDVIEEIKQLKAITNHKPITAVNWLWDISQDRELDKFDFEQAIAMEKKQIEDAWYAKDKNWFIHEFGYYYNETYGSNNE